VTEVQPLSFFQRYEFTIRRLHSLTGIVPVGVYLIIHILTNASVVNSPATFQQNVYSIHTFDTLLPAIEWTFIFLPILFHGGLGVWLAFTGASNTRAYPYPNNIRYLLQRITGMIAAVFILWHVLHMHGWFHFDWWKAAVAYPLGGAQFRPFNATSTSALAMRASAIIPVLYAIGLLSSVYHFANGIWTAGITWGVWTSAAAQVRASAVCALFGVGLASVGMTAIVGLWTVDVQSAIQMEEAMYQSKLASGAIRENEEKRISSLPWHEEIKKEYGVADEKGGDRDSEK